MPHRPCHCRYHAVSLRDMEAHELGDSATRPVDAQQPPVFRYNSWDSGTLSMTRPTSDLHMTHSHCQPPGHTMHDSWPIVSTAIVTDIGSPSTHFASSARPSPVDGPSQSRSNDPPNQLNLAAQTRHGPDAVIREFTHFIGFRFATRARFFSSSLIGSEAGSGLSASGTVLALAIRECHDTMTELLFVPSSSSPTSPDEKPCALLVPIHFNGIKLGVLVCTPWKHVESTGQNLERCTAECCLAKRNLTQSTMAPSRMSGLCQSVCKDRVHELLRRLSGFFAAYLHSAKQRRVNQETVRQFQHQLALVEATAQAKGTFLANMSHEIRTPAAQVVQAAHILSETQLDSVQQEHVEVILKSSELLLAIPNDILDLNKLENGKIRFENRPFDLHDAIRQSVDAYAGNKASRWWMLAT
ncbi:hypothetical protein BCR44DRAFT_1288870 [Catenaria anguillulae PL171]|uniref:Signal transduction histidine kinase dimerisation/phosphoacceptor domain-containing protein n=1 Tax=Catenaria anguillulae PL171 TaxID=765915 RepID=A0A1Y2H8B4_9FUNG|nr:hypothetical protein BCR44DRAFT_1288870 [Catenaria anguillulae PL171]